jgi:DedD protein
MPPNQPVDQELQFKKRARRRLVGAIALVLLMVTVLPMILDDRASQAPQQEIAITIPSQDDSDFTSKIVPVEPGSEADIQSSSALPEPKPIPEPAEEKPAEVAPVKSPPPADVIKAEPAEAVAKQKTAESKPATVADSGTAFYVQIGVYSDAANVKKLQDKLQGQGYKSYTEKIGTSKGEKIRLRAGPFGSRLEAEGALAKIKDSGLSGMVVKNG